MACASSGTAGVANSKRAPRPSPRPAPPRSPPTHLQPRVHVSPMSMMVAVAVWPSLPPQHSPMLGHLASSHTVASLSSRSLDLICRYFSPPGMTFFIQSGFRFFSCIFDWGRCKAGG
jgi:hypothetical protein